MNPQNALSLIERELGEIDKCVSHLTADHSAMVRGDPMATRALAFDMQALYTGCELVLTRCLRVYGERPKESSEWHKDLLEQATAAAPDRPAVVSAKTGEMLMDLLKFRHMARSAYPQALNEGRMLVMAKAIPTLHSTFSTEIRAFVEVIKASSERHGSKTIPKEPQVEPSTGSQSKDQKGAGD